MTLILFTTVAPHPLSEELFSQGYQVYEALAVSEVFSLIEQHPTASIIITADVDQERAKAIQQHYPTLHLKPAATVKDIFWGLGLQQTNATVQ
ncbi:MAG: hypothetical protein ACXVKC_04420 [Candidatus Angelobacter sp.]